MVKVRDSLIGKTFGRLTVINQAEDYITPKGVHYAQWMCECSCGNNVIVTSSHLKSNKIRSCGCLRKESNKERFSKENFYKLDGDYGIGWTTNTNREFYFDLEDYDKIKDYCWRECTGSNGNYHFIGTSINIDEKRNTVAIHQIITGKRFMDHKDRDPFNNRKENLREATYCENSWNHNISNINTSGVIGVYFTKNINKWLARIVVNHEIIDLGYFTDKNCAIKKRLEAEAKYYGEFAPQIYLFDQYNIEL